MHKTNWLPCKDLTSFRTDKTSFLQVIQALEILHTLGLLVILRTLESRFEKYDLVVCDEFGYISFDKNAAELLFTHLSLRAGRKSTIITTNLSFDRWTEIFGDEVITAAMVDRLTHKAILVNMNGKSVRAKESELLNNTI